MFCGLKLESTKKGDTRTHEEKTADERELFKQKCFEEELEYLRRTRDKLIKFNMTTTGSDDLDKTLIHYLGDWLDKAGREAVNIVNAARKMQQERGVVPTRAETMRIACEAGLLRSTREAIYRAVHSHQYEEDDATRMELAARR